MSAAPLEPHRPVPSRYPIDTLSKAAARLEVIEKQILEAREKMGKLGVEFSRAKAHLKELLQARTFLKEDQDEALAALQAQDGHQEHQVLRESSATSSSRKRPLPTALIPQEKKKKLATDPQEKTKAPIWPKAARRG